MFPALSAALNAGDIVAALSLYEPNAGFVTATGGLARGESGLRGEFEAIVAVKATMTGRAAKTIIVKDLALVFVEYKALIPNPEGGATVELAGLSTDVLRQQPDGTWLSVIDNPFGTALVSGQPVAQEILDLAPQDHG